MAAKIGSIYASLTLDVQPYVGNWNRATTATVRGAQQISKNVGIANRSVAAFAGASSSFRPAAIIAASRSFERASDRVNTLRGAILLTTSAFGGLAAAIGSNIVLRYADTYTSLHNQMRVVSQDSADLAARFSEVEAVARRSRSSLQSTATLYSRLAKAAPNRSAEQMLRYTETIQKSLTLGGATPQEAASAAIQLSQAIASNRLGGEELRAILETPLGLELAKGLDVTIGKFREMGYAGELTADVVFKALERVSGSIDRQFAQSVRTMDQAIVHLDNALINFFGSADKAYGVTRAMSSAIVALADNLPEVIGSLTVMAGLLGAGFAGRAAAGLGGRLFRPVLEQARQTKAALEDIRKQNSLLQEQLERDAIRAERAVWETRGDPSRFADKSAVSEYQRASLAITRADEQNLAIKERIAQQTRELGLVTSRMAGGAVASTNKIIAAEKKHAEALVEVGRRRLALIDADKAVADALAGQGDVGRNRMGGFYKAAFDMDEARARLDAAREVERIAKRERVENLRALRAAQAAGDAQSVSMFGANTGTARRAVQDAVAARRAAYDQFLEIERRYAVESAKLDDLAAASKSQNVDRAIAARVAAQQDLQSAEQRVAQRRQALLEAQTALIGKQADADDRASRRRLAIARSLDAEYAALAKNEVTRAEAVKAARVAADKVSRSGTQNVGAILGQASTAVAATRASLEKTTASMIVMQKAASAAGVGLWALRSAGAGLLGVFGGPWGLAITAAITGLGLLAARAQKAAAEVENAQRVISDALARAGQSMDGGGEAERKSLLEIRMENVRKEIDIVSRRADTLRSELGSALAGMGVGATGVDTRLGKVRGEVMALFDLVSRGQMSIDEFASRMQNMGRSVPELAPHIDEIVQAAREYRHSTQALEQLNKELDRLDSQRAKDILIRIRTVHETFGTPPAEFTLDGDAARSASTTLFLSEMQKELDLLRMSTKERTIARYAEDRLAEARERGLGITKEQAYAWAAEKYALEENNKEVKKAGREYERLSDILADIRGEGEGAFFSDLDRDVISRSKRLPGSGGLIAQYVEAVKSGDLTKIPPQLREIRNALQEVQSADTYRGIVQQYGNAAQVSQQFADKQEVLNRLVKDGWITAEQAGRAWGEYVTSFGEYSWIEGMSGALADASGSLANVALGYETLTDAVENFKRAILNVAIEEFLTTPLRNLFRTMMSAPVSGGGGFLSGIFGGLLGGASAPLSLGTPGGTGGLYDKGGFTGPGGKNDVAGLVHRGEYVFSAKAVRSLGLDRLNALHEGALRGYARGGYVGSAAMSRLAGQASFEPRISVINATGVEAQPEVRAGADGSIEIILNAVEGRLASRVANNKGTLSRAMKGRGLRDFTKG